MKSSPKNFSTLGLLLFLRTALSSSSWIFTGGRLKDSIGVTGSGINLDENFKVLCISFIGKTFSKNVASRNSIIVSTYTSGTSDFTTKN